MRIHGNLQVSSAVTSNMGFDFAESFVALEDMEPGDLVMAVNRNSVRKATRDDAAFVIGAVSTSPGIVITDPSVPNQKAIGLAGRIPVKVTGVVQRGDFITVSDIPGVGMAAREPSFVIGRAIDEVDANGMVFMVIQPSYFSPQVDVNNELLGGKRGRVFEAGLAVRENAGAGSTATAGRPRGQDRVVELGASDDIVVTLG